MFPPIFIVHLCSHSSSPAHLSSASVCPLTLLSPNLHSPHLPPTPLSRSGCTFCPPPPIVHHCHPNTLRTTTVVNIPVHSHVMAPIFGLRQRLHKRGVKYRPALPTIGELQILREPRENPRTDIVHLCTTTLSDFLPRSRRQRTDDCYPESSHRLSTAGKKLPHALVTPPKFGRRQCPPGYGTTRSRRSVRLPVIDELEILDEPPPGPARDKAGIVEFCRAAASDVSPMLLPSSTACLWLYQLCGGYLGVLRGLLTLAAEEAFFPLCTHTTQTRQ